MAFCPKCRIQYDDSAVECATCRRLLRKGRLGLVPSVDLDEAIVPGLSALCLLVASGMLYLRAQVDAGRVAEPYAALVLATQPPCLVVFYAIAAFVSVVVLVLWLIRTLFGSS